MLMKKILILGSTGFIGKNLYEYFSNMYHVDAPSRQEINVINENQVYGLLKKGKYDIILNALDLRQAGSDYFENRLRMFINLEKYSDLYGKMIYFGSGAEYGRNMMIHDIREEEFNRIIPEDTYGFCLHQMSKYALNSKNIYNFRLFGIFGKYEIWQKRFISNAICKALYEFPITIRQNTVFDYLYIDDLCKIVEWAIENEPRYHDYNAVSGIKYELKDMADIVKQITGSNVPIIIAQEGLGKEYTASCNRLVNEMINFKPESAEESIRRLTNWYQENIKDIDKIQLLYQ